jgi:hypothetical protein
MMCFMSITAVIGHDGVWALAFIILSLLCLLTGLWLMRKEAE